jgi:hypothetical protein
MSLGTKHRQKQTADPCKQHLRESWSADRDPIEGERRFTSKDEEASTLKVQITQCDEFTRKCLERQVTLQGYESVEQFIAEAALNILENLENDTVLDPRTGEAIMSYSDGGSFIGCMVEKNAPEPPPDNFRSYIEPPRGDR